MIKTPFLSACVITHNHAAYIKETIEGVLMQKVDFPWELIIADDFSTDGTREILLEYKKKYPQFIKLILQTNNAGVEKNFSDLINAVKSKYMAFLDGDDYWTDPLKLQIQVDEMEKHLECDMCCHTSFIKHLDGSRPDNIKFYHGDSIKIFYTKDIITTGGGFCHIDSLVCRRNMFNNIPKFFLERLCDYFLEILGSIRGGILYIPRCMSVYRSFSIGSWSEKNKKNFEHYLWFYSKYNDILNELDKYMNYKYSKEIERRITMTNYLVWKRFKTLNKKETGNYESLKDLVNKLKINKILLIKALLANKIHLLFNFIKK